MNGKSDRKRHTRRDVLKSAAAAVAVLSWQGELFAGSSNKRARGVIVARLSTRDTNSCNACKEHHRYKVFISPAHADRNRAHPGCNCPIKRQKMPLADFRRLFLDTRLIRVGVVDLRQVDGDRG